ncbi:MULTISPECIES: hypothetical protein [Sphingomonas]|uniref:Protoheme IX farnesyltransferase n=2 Tax=Sphingomonas TaxID=13687 RepID=A0A7W9BQ68_9SPHN|nr:hypothetical protein [Sphingomonas prati]MBB5728122.1 hypothetical protein [Sphingomonas prati]
MTPDLTPAQEAELRRRQKSRSIVMGLCLGALAVLFFGISMAKML